MYEWTKLSFGDIWDLLEVGEGRTILDMTYPGLEHKTESLCSLGQP